MDENLSKNLALTKSITPPPQIFFINMIRNIFFLHTSVLKFYDRIVVLVGQEHCLPIGSLDYLTSFKFDKEK